MRSIVRGDTRRALGEIFNLEALAADCAADGRHAFMLAAPTCDRTFPRQRHLTSRYAL
jgi:hypothetical protein